MFWSLFKTILRRLTRRLYFAKLLTWDLLICIPYKIVWFVAVCHIILWYKGLITDTEFYWYINYNYEK
jgi:hypothetical protein